MYLPEFADVSVEALHAISERHGLGGAGAVLLPSIGITNAMYALGGQHILRVPRNHPNVIATAYREARAVPLARRVGVRTPDLVVFDDSREIITVPYAIYERAPGEPLGLLAREPHETTEAYRCLGRDLARLHEGVTESDVDPCHGCALTPEGHPEPEQLAAEGYFTAVEARWLAGWFDQLAPAMAAPVRPCFLHGDVQATNVLVQGLSNEQTAILDWGNAGWGDVAIDFVGLPLRAVPLVLEGHRQVAPLAGEETIEARILYYHLWFALMVLSRPPLPDLAWAERPTGMLLEILRFFLERPAEPWDRLAPPSSLG
jgi:aminoglycoside phosphotransferase (APT) family kinase protein